MQVGNGPAVVAANGVNHGLGDGGRGIYDGDNYHKNQNHKNQEVIITNIDLGSPCATGMPEEGVNRR